MTREIDSCDESGRDNPPPRSETEAMQDAERVTSCLETSGFSRVGFAASSDAPGGDRYLEWLSRGYHGNMHYLARRVERRLDPASILPAVKTLIVMATHYEASATASIANPRDDLGDISSYARGEDYHRVLERRLVKAKGRLEELFPGEQFRYYVDTGPVLEKAWAERAGIGWIGKNTCSIDRHSGSYFFLSVILTTLELPASVESTDHCGSCRLCIDACPTDAFVEPYVLDARRCISYLTIEERGAIAPDLEARMGNLVFGCDICQEVCPWNNTSTQTQSDPELAARPENELPKLAQLTALATDSFARRFPRSPVKRAKPGGFLRNVIIALGNSDRQECQETLENLSDREDIVSDEILGPTLERALQRSSDAKERADDERQG